MAGKGGARPGAGRPKAAHTIESEALKAYLVAEIVKKKEPLIQALIKKALTGDVPALKEVLERTLGRVPQPITGEGGGPLSIVFDESFKTKQSDSA